MDLIISHNNCLDGWVAAYIAKKKYPEAEILLLNYGIDPEPVIAQAAGKDVIMLDYSLRTRELNDRLNRGAKSLRILDHHRTAEVVLAGAGYATFDMSRSGAGLAWDYLFGKDSESSKYSKKEWGDNLALMYFGLGPWFVRFVEDQDLWNWALPRSQDIHAFLMTRPRTVEAWDEITHMASEAAASKGEGVRQYIEYYTRTVVAEAQVGTLSFGPHKYKTAVLNIPYAGVSEAGNALVADAKYDVALLWFERGDGMTQFSLRSNRNGSNVDVGAIAKYFGGGGHHNSAGFQIALPTARVIVDTVLGRSPVPYTPEIVRSPGGCA
jgi:uncharacterized protein